MAVMLVAATGRELRAAHRGAGFSCQVPEQGETVRAELGGRPLLLLVTGVGPVNAALALGRALALHETDLVLNLGVCGSFDVERAPLASRILVREEIWPEYGIRGAGENAADARSIGLAQGRIGDSEVWDRVALAGTGALERAGLGVPRDLIQCASLTVAGVTGTQERAEALQERYGASAENQAGVSAENQASVLAENQASVLAENMEGFPLAYASALQGIDCVELRTVSNKVGERAPGTWDLKGALKALEAMAAELFPSPA